MTIYDDVLPIAKELLGEFKQGTVSLIRLTPGAGSADDPGSVTETTYTLDAVVKGASFKYVNSGFATVTDLEVTAAPIDGVTPTKNDFILINNQHHKIIEYISAPANGTKIVWKFLVR